MVDRDGTVMVADGAGRRQPMRHGPGEVLAAILATVDELAAAAPPGGRRARRSGWRSPASSTSGAGSAVHSQNVGWRDVPVRSLVEQATGLPVGFGHDVRAGTLAEWRLGAGRGLQDLVFVPIGTGVSAGIIVQGRLDHRRRLCG